MSDQNDPMAEIRVAFFQECEELLEALQDGLTAMEEGTSDDETINVVFRAVHSIKGGAGAFGLDELVRFAHRYETTLDNVRAGKLAPEGDALRVFFRSGDLLSDIVRASRDDTSVDETKVNENLAELGALLGDDFSEEDEDFDEVDSGDFTPTGFSMDLPDLGGDDAAGGLPDLGMPGADLATPDMSGTDAVPDIPVADVTMPDAAVDLGGDDLTAFEIHFTPTQELFSTGNEPVYLFRSLRDLGEMQVAVNTENLPQLSDMEPEGSYLSWTIRLVTEESESQVREAFDFVADICTLDIQRTEIATFEDESTAENAPFVRAPEVMDPSLMGEAPSAPTPAAAPTPADPQPAPQTTPASEASATPAAPPTAAETTPDETADTAETEAAKPAAPAAPINPVLARVKASLPGSSDTKAVAKPRGTVRVDLERVDRLVNLVGELVINQAMLSQSVAEAGIPANTSVFTGLDELQQLTRDIQDSVMMIRAQPVKTLFQRMARIVRESSADVGKNVRLHSEGEETEVDKTVIERLADPLTHMIRNAVDHGLESTEEREAVGKSGEGVISLTARHRSGRVVIEVCDDGGGINREKVLAKAVEKGLVAEDAQLSDVEIDNLLFLPGFSTADQISNLSGRGVGMDVVRSSIQALGGRITISSEKGKGTTFSISLPLTLAVLDGMVIEVANETLVVPLNMIEETLTLTEEDISGLGPETNVVKVRNGFVPLLDLGTELGYRSPCDSYVGTIVLLIAHEDGSRAALVVDEIRDQRQVVIKGLQDGYGRVAGIAAATILGDGQIALILDPVDIISGASGRTKATEDNLALVG